MQYWYIDRARWRLKGPESGTLHRSWQRELICFGRPAVQHGVGVLWARRARARSPPRRCRRRRERCRSSRGRSARRCITRERGSVDTWSKSSALCAWPHNVCVTKVATQPIGVESSGAGVGATSSFVEPPKLARAHPVWTEAARRPHRNALSAVLALSVWRNLASTWATSALRRFVASAPMRRRRRYPELAKGVSWPRRLAHCRGC